MSDERPPSSSPAWDRIIERDQKATPELEQPGVSPSPISGGNLNVAVFAAAWADIVCIVAVCTLGLAVLVVMGHQANLRVLPWGLALGLLWWSAAAAATLTVRRGTPGMLMAGVVSREALTPKRIPMVLAAALLSSLFGGLPALLGAQRSAIRAAIGSELVENTGEREEL